MSKKRLFVFLILGLVLLFAVVGCGSTQEPQGTDAQGELSGSIQVVGSTSVQPLSEELATAFMAKYPDVTVNVAGGGSGAGIKAAREGSADIGSSSRELKEEEKGTVVETVIAYDGIAVIVHSSNSISEITMDDIKKVFTGEITNWSELGGSNAPITVYTREEGSGTRGAFTEIAFGEGINITPHAIIQNSNGALRTAIAGDPNGIGYLSFGYLNEEVKDLKVDGVEPLAENVKNGSYPISRPFLYLTKEEPTGLVKAYMDFVLGPEGQEIVAKDYITIL